MAQRTIVYWRDIPAQVIVKAGRRTAKRELPTRFIEAIDRCAMRTDSAATDAYLADWRRGEPEPVGDDLEAEADRSLAELDTRYSAERLRALVEAGGREDHGADDRAG